MRERTPLPQVTCAPEWDYLTLKERPQLEQAFPTERKATTLRCACPQYGHVIVNVGWRTTMRVRMVMRRVAMTGPQCFVGSTRR